jgi:hypothetical protein
MEVHARSAWYTAWSSTPLLSSTTLLPGPETPESLPPLMFSIGMAGAFSVAAYKLG